MRLSLCWICWFLVLPLFAQDPGKDSILANTYKRSGEQFLEQADYPAGNELLHKAAQLYQKHKLWLPYFETQNAIAKGLWRGGDAEQAIVFSRQILTQAAELLGENSIAAIDAYSNMGAAYGMKGYREISMNYFDRSLALRRKILGENDPSLTKAYHNLGTVLYKEGSYEAALEKLNKALDLKILHFGTEDKNLISTYQVLGMVYIEKQAYNQAREYFQKALRLIQSHYGELHPQTAEGFLRLGIAYSHDGQPEVAFEHFARAERIADSIYTPLHAYRIPIYNNVGEAHMQLGNAPQALSYFEKAHQAALENYGRQHPQVLHILSNLGRCQEQAGNHRAALALFLQARQGLISLYGDKNADVAEQENALARQYEKMGVLDSALFFAHQALQSNIPNFVDSLPQNNPNRNDARYYSGQALVESLFLKGSVFRRQAQTAPSQRSIALLENALQAFLLALDFTDVELRNLYYKADQVALLATAQDLYKQIMSLSYNLSLLQPERNAHYKKLAFSLSDKNKSVLLTQALHQSNALRFGGIPDDILRQERDLKTDVADLEKKLLNARAERDAERTAYFENQLFQKRSEQSRLEDILKNNYNRYYELKYRQPSVDADDLTVRTLAPEQALVEYFYRDSVLYAFCIDHDRGLSMRAVSARDLEALVRQLRLSLTHLPVADSEQAFMRRTLIEASSGLHDLLIAPLGLPDRVRRLVVVPDGMLNYVPFDLLLERQPQEQQPYSDWDYLIKRYAIGYSYTGALLQEFARRNASGGNHKMLAMAPGYEDKSSAATRPAALQELRRNLEPLPGARQEVEQLQGLFAGRFVVGTKATEAVFMEQLSEYGILHLAMHGLLDHKQPSESALVFSESEDSLNDNFLFAYEINNLPLRADLVVLSACQTGYGKLLSGEGSMSIARSFMYAGAPALMMTMWEVNDQAMQRLMYDFYQNLLGGQPKDIALQNAKLDYLRQAKGLSAHPFLWAAPAVLGDMRPVRIDARLSYGWFVWGALACLGFMLAWRIRIYRREKNAALRASSSNTT